MDQLEVPSSSRRLESVLKTKKCSEASWERTGSERHAAQYLRCLLQTTEGAFTEVSIYPILPVALGPVVYSASNRNEYQKHKYNVSGK
jgi:hypothetical protein